MAHKSVPIMGAITVAMAAAATTADIMAIAATVMTLATDQGQCLHPEDLTTDDNSPSQL